MHRLTERFRVGFLTVFVMGGSASLAMSQVQVLSIQSDSSTPGDAAAKVGGAITLGNTFSFGGVDPSSRSALFSLLSNASVRRELKLQDQQYEGAKKIMGETQRRIVELVQASMAAGQQARGEAIREAIEAGRKQSEAALEEILLPEQLARVRQLAYQIDVANKGLGESLVNGRLGTEIDVHDDQKQHLTDKATAIEAEMRDAIAKIRAAARAKMFAELTPEQRKKAEELLGPYFDYEETSLATTFRAAREQINAISPKQSESSRKK